MNKLIVNGFNQNRKLHRRTVAGAIQRSAYLQHITDAGFTNLQVQKEKPIVIPDDILAKSLSAEEVNTFNRQDTGIFSITVYAEKPGERKEKVKLKLSELTANNCTPGSGCC